MESAARSRLGSGGAGRHPPDERPDRAGVAVAAPALYRRDVSRAAGDSPRPLLRRLRRVPRGDAAEPADRCLVVSPRPACRGAPPLWGRSGRAARADEPRRPADLPGRAPDEAGPDEHVGVDREPGALSRSGAGRVRGGDAGAFQARRIADEGGSSRSGPRPGAPRDSQRTDRKSTRLNSSHTVISYAVFCLKKKKKKKNKHNTPRYID